MEIRVKDGKILVENQLTRNGKTVYVEQQDITDESVSAVIAQMMTKESFNKDGYDMVTRKINDKEYALSLTTDNFVILEKDLYRQLKEFEQKYNDAQEQLDKANKELSELKDDTSKEIIDGEFTEHTVEDDPLAYTE